ncbi:MAG TPA: substrate-binding domain-containing protein [Burkholderiales bacterium]
MRLEPYIAWRGAGRMLDPRVLPLLREIRARATLRAATAAVGLSYRAAWDLLNAQARSLGAPLVVMSRGRGARLAPLAERLLGADDAAQAELQGARERLSVQVDEAPARSRLLLAASHDLLLAEFIAHAQLGVELAFRGSLESVSAFARGDADLAGFHAPAGQAAAYRRLLAPRRDRVILFARREQGLIVPKGNPRGVRSLSDVARRGLRFVNRQRGSGTRQLVDELLREAGVAAGALKGYADEEFTHAAVAATVASGRADAGIGVRAAAARFGLGFVALRRETYWLAARQRLLAERPVERLIAALQGRSLRAIAARLTGYDTAGAGTVHPLSVLEEAS